MFLTRLSYQKGGLMKHETVPPITSRIFDVLTKKNITQTNFAKLIGTRQSTVSGWRQKCNEPEAELLELIASVLDVSIEWLITGKEAKKNINHLPEHKKLIECYNNSNETGKERIMEQAIFLSEKHPSNLNSSGEKGA